MSKPGRLTAMQMARKLQTMAVTINSQTKLTHDDHILPPENGWAHEIIVGECCLSRAW